MVQKKMLKFTMFNCCATKRGILILVMLMFTQIMGNSSFAQNRNWSEISRDELLMEYQKMKNYYSSLNSYSVQITYTSYKDYETNEVEDQSLGFYRKSKSNYHNYMVGYRTIQNQENKIVIDEEEKIIMVLKTTEIKTPEVVFDTNTFESTMLTVVKKSTVGKVNYYRLEYKDGYEVKAVEFCVNSVGFMNEITFFYQKSFENEDEKVEIIYPRLNIKYFDLNTKYIPKANEFDVLKYFYIKEDKINATPEFSQFKILDLRGEK